MTTWYNIDNIHELSSPALAVYPDRILKNIEIAKQYVSDVQWLRPHVKTNKCAQICEIMMAEGINKFKCSTIAEAEMLCKINAKDVLLAYQPVGPTVTRFINLAKNFPVIKLSCLIDNQETAELLSAEAINNDIVISAFIDINVGMNRTGITTNAAFDLFTYCQTLKGLAVIGLHAYDGHLRDSDLTVRKRKSDEAFLQVEKLFKKLKGTSNHLTIIAGGTPTFPTHAVRQGIECSPGTFILWDKGYEQILPDEHFVHAAVIITRVVSKPDEDLVTTDLGHKSIASENPLNNRVFFLNAPDAIPVGHSEEHLVLKVNQNKLKVGDVLYGIPYHICPTVALHEKLAVVKAHHYTEDWEVTSRKRKITI